MIIKKMLHKHTLINIVKNIKQEREVYYENGRLRVHFKLQPNGLISSVRHENDIAIEKTAITKNYFLKSILSLVEENPDKWYLKNNIERYPNVINLEDYRKVKISLDKKN